MSLLLTGVPKSMSVSAFHPDFEVDRKKTTCVPGGMGNPGPEEAR